MAHAFVSLCGREAGSRHDIASAPISSSPALLKALRYMSSSAGGHVSSSSGTLYNMKEMHKYDMHSVNNGRSYFYLSHGGNFQRFSNRMREAEEQDENEEAGGIGSVMLAVGAMGAGAIGAVCLSVVGIAGALYGASFAAATLGTFFMSMSIIIMHRMKQ